jgi:hypothetical protein
MHFGRQEYSQAVGMRKNLVPGLQTCSFKREDASEDLAEAFRARSWLSARRLISHEKHLNLSAGSAMRAYLHIGYDFFGIGPLYNVRDLLVVLSAC